MKCGTALELLFALDIGDHASLICGRRETLVDCPTVHLRSAIDSLAFIRPGFIFLRAKIQKPIPLNYCIYVGTVVAIIALSSPLEAGSAPKVSRAEPYVLNLALPHLLLPSDSKSGTSEREELEAHIRDRFHKLYCPSRHCPDDRRLHINIAFGNDYQLLDWLGKGWVDSAVIPSLSLYLLRRDGLDLRDIGPELGARRSPTETPKQRDDLSRDLEKFWKWIWERVTQQKNPQKQTLGSRNEKDTCQLITSSHLATGDFLMPLAATSEWLEKQPGGDQLADQFWREFFDHLRFTFDSDPAASPNKSADCGLLVARRKPPPRSVSALLDSSEYHFVITTRRATAIFPGGAQFKPAEAQIPDPLPKLFDGELKPTERKKKSMPRVFRPLVLPEPYFGVRTFAFTIDESIDLLRQQETPEKNILALVLPGGGVKAGFQSRLIEHLYSKKYLRNNTPSKTRFDPRGDEKALDVDYIIGTSGGALLGFFVAQLGEDGPWNLSELLWKRDGQPLQSTEIFGFFDLARYISLLVIFAILCILLRCSQSWPNVEGKMSWRWRLRLLLTIGPILLLTPFLVRYMNGAASQEHIPEIEGFFYMAFTIIAMFADQCLVKESADRSRKEKWRTWTAGLLLLCGALAMIAILRIRTKRPDAFWLDEPVPILGVHVGALVVCLAALFLLVGAILWIISSRGYQLARPREFLKGATLVLIHMALVYLALIVMVAFFPNVLSLLELTAEFWVALVVASIVVGLIVLWIAKRLPAFRDGVQYLCNPHPNGNIIPRRVLRLLLLGAFAIIWWNFIVAPGLYGNKHARDSFRSVIKGFRDASSAADQSNFLTSRLIVPANVLDRDGTRYFLFAPTEQDCPDLVRKPGDGATWWRLWVNGSWKDWPNLDVKPCEKGAQSPYTFEDLEKVVFASGSPFPVFPAHRIGAESLVDGGYSNNVPLDAAQTVSADAALIVESSHPLGHEAGFFGWLWERYLTLPGALIGNLPRLASFLYERSQQIDRISRSDLFVVSLAPPRDEPGWPLLVDFRPSTIERMQTVAEKNLSRRIGMVQSWGRPRFQVTIRIGSPVRRSGP
jgi:predicted acylesterase/phospholipase RssA